MRIELGPRELSKPIVAAVLMTPSAGQDVRVDGVEFRGVQVGTDEVTLDNSHQAIPWHFRIKLDLSGRKFFIDYSIKNLGRNVRQQLLAARIQHALSVGCQFAVEAMDTGISVVAANIAPGSVPALPAGLVKLFETLDYIQTVTRIPLSVPDLGISQADAQSAFGLALRLKDGRVTGNVNELTIALTRAGAELITQDGCPAGHDEWRVEDTETWRLFDVEIPLGRVVSITKNLGLTESDRTRLRNELTEDPRRTEFSARLTPLKGRAPVTVYYLSWMPQGEADAIRNRQASSRPMPDATTD